MTMAKPFGCFPITATMREHSRLVSRYRRQCPKRISARSTIGNCSRHPKMTTPQQRAGLCYPLSQASGRSAHTKQRDLRFSTSPVEAKATPS